MHTVEAHVATDRPGRYLVQLCRHGSQMGLRLGHRPRPHAGGDTPPTVQHAESSDTDGSITFDQGRCILRTMPDGLLLRVEAVDEQSLRRIQDGIGRRLEKIGRRDQLTVNWRQAEALTAVSDEAGSYPMDTDGARRSRLQGIGLTVAVVVVIAVHLGLGGTFLADARWTGWVANLVMLLVAVKLLTVGWFALRRSRASRSS